MNRTTEYPGVYVKEINTGANRIIRAPTTFTAFVGLTRKGPLNKATEINNFSQFVRIFGEQSEHHNIGYAVEHFFLNGGGNAIIVSVGNDKTTTSEKIVGKQGISSGIYSLDKVNFNILCIPPYDQTETTKISVYEKALEYCKK